MTTHYVRLKPYQPKKGFTTKTYTFRGHRFEESKGWSQVNDDALVAELRELHQKPYDDQSPALFDVCTKEEALALERSERRKKELGGKLGVEAAAEEALSKAGKVRSGIERAKALAGAVTVDDLKPEEKERVRRKLLGLDEPGDDAGAKKDDLPEDDAPEGEEDAEPKEGGVVTEVGKLGGADDEGTPEDEAGAEGTEPEPEAETPAEGTPAPRARSMKPAQEPKKKSGRSK